MNIDKSCLSYEQRVAVEDEHDRIKTLNRDWGYVEDRFWFLFEEDGEYQLIKEVLEKIRSLPEGEQFVYVDGGCGTGMMAETFLDKLVFWVGLQVVYNSWDDFRKKFSVTAFDLNPVPELIEPYQFRKHREMLPEGAQDLCVNYRIGDVSNPPIKPGSVDLYTCIESVLYVDDILKALKAGWDILKTGGRMLFTFDMQLSSDPSFDQILRNTPHSDEIFDWRRTVTLGGNTHCAGCITKVPGLNLEFPYKHIRAESSYSESDHLEGWLHFIRRGIYRQI